MFYRNEAARDYEITVVFDPDEVTRTSLDEVDLAGQWLASLIGDYIGVAYLAYSAVATSTYTTTLTLTGGILSASPVSTGSLAKATLRCLFTNLLLTVDGDCDAWELTADQVDLYYTWNSGSETLWDSASSVSLSGSAYDARENYCVDLNLDPNGVFPVTATCAASYAAQTTGAVEATLEGTGQWRWRTNSGPGSWQYEDIVFEVVPLPIVGSGGCGSACIGDVADIDGTTSQEISSLTSVSYAIDKSSRSEISCPCPGAGTGGTYEYWNLTFDYEYKPRRFRMVPRNAGILTTYRAWSASRNCTGGGPYSSSGNSTTDEPFTYADHSGTVGVIDLDRLCVATVTPPLCIPGSGDYVYCGPTATSDLCAFDGEVELSHPDLPPCLGGTFVSTDAGDDRRLITVYDAMPSGELTTWIQDQALGTGEVVPTGIVVTDAEIRIQLRDQDSLVRVVSVEGGSVKIRESTDWGRTFGAATTVGSGSMICSDIGRNGIQYVYWIDGAGPYNIKGRRYDRALNALESAYTYVSGVDNIQPAVSASPGAGGAHRVILRYYTGGVLTTKTSVDGVN